MSDKKIQHSTNHTTVDYYNSDVVAANDYYPGGMQMPGREYQVSSTSYRYGFNGKENDNEIKGEGNQQDYGMRIYDTRLNRFLSVDPLTRKYPWYSPGQQFDLVAFPVYKNIYASFQNIGMHILLNNATKCIESFTHISL